VAMAMSHRGQYRSNTYVYDRTRPLGPGRRSVDLAGPSSNHLPPGAGTRQPRARRGEHEKTTLEDVALLVANLRSLASSREHAPALARLRKAVRWR
jgi:hypothetical protein